MQDGSRKAIIAAFFANLGIAIAKFVGFLITGSASMLAESIHSLADTGNQGLLLLGGTRARRQADCRAPLRLRPGALLLGLRRGRSCSSAWAALFALYEGDGEAPPPPRARVGRVGRRHPGRRHRARGVLVPHGHRGGQPRARATRAWWRFIRQSKAPELPVVLLEDLGALVGLCFALAGVALAELTGNARWDAVGTPRHRRAARGHRHHPRHRDEEPAHRRGRLARPAPGAIERAIDVAPRVRSSSTCAPSTSAPTSSWSGPRSSSTRSCPSPRWPTQ